MKIESQCDATTQAIGETLAKLFQYGQVVALHGNLGAGKTVLSRGIARGLGITEPVTSPTFTVAQEYKTPDGHWLYHLDMYRIDDEMAAIAFGVEDYLTNRNAIALVEWPERISRLLDGNSCIVVTINHLDEETRELDLPDALGEKLLQIGLPEGARVIEP